MTYEEALEYIHSVDWRGARPGLHRIRELMEKMGDPQKKLRFVHVAGTNGKGSTCAMLDAILRAAGYKTGLFTSPYLRFFGERIRVNGACIADDELAEITAYVKSFADTMADRPTEFELVTAIGLEYFARKKCRVVVLEVGLGGRLDATNVIDSPDCAVITNLGLDHTEVLGDTIEKIALEKAGIVKPGTAVAMYPCQDESAISAVAAVCRERGASLRVADFDELEVLSDGLEGQTFCYCDDRPLYLPLLGDHQSRNACVALEAVEILRERGYKKLSDEAVEQGLANTRWPARFEIVSEKPYFVVDGGHNPQCAAAVAENLDYYFEGQRRVLLIGMLRDKDVEGFTDRVAPVADAFVCVEPESPRAMPAAELGKVLKKYEKPVFVCGSIPEGVRTAMGAAGRDGVVCSVGSLYMVGAVRACFGLE
ncbi:MAG: bifunctional folylpolyglutamate synthase/dihydrofolate synthase [Oscillospiraceae bacterium]